MGSIDPTTYSDSATAQQTEVYLPHIPSTVGLPVTVTIDGYDFIHQVTQADLDAGSHVNQVQSVLTALESLIDASSDVNVGAIASNGVLQLTADNTDVPFTVSLARPSGVDIVVTGENTASFTASFQVQNVELESHTVGAGVDADATTAQVTRIEIDPMHGPDTVGDAYTVTVNSTDFTHVVTQSDLDSTDPTATVLGALETLIEEDTGLGLTADLSSSEHVNYRPDDTNTASAPASAAGLTQVAGETVTFTSTPRQVFTETLV